MAHLELLIPWRGSTKQPRRPTYLKHSSPSFGSRQECSHSNPSQKIKVGRRCTPQGDPANQLPCALRVYSPVDSHTCQTPWSVFQDGPNGAPAGLCQEHADAEARQEARAATTIDATASPRAYLEPGLWPPRQSAQSFSSFPRGTCSLSVSRPYLALDGIHRPIWAAFPNNPTRRQRLVVRQGPGTTGLSPSLAPPSRGLGPGPPLRTLLQTTIRTTGPPDSKAGLFPRVIPPDLGSRSERARRRAIRVWESGRTTGCSRDNERELSFNHHLPRRPSTWTRI
ncbi:hypothetical protein H5410_064038 [Solanum commersonii]|uniref:Protein TAR1 n=1 Tax=Solanum commersonii TaxID=4109 RepID=A0A9J5W0Q4_SOLCO|nr:hypothetical protein H5410_064038 [Solanum commersonii]